MILLPLFVFAFGLLIGSFLNVVILRMNTGRSMVTGRSKCARCNTTLRWHDLIPVFSFLCLRGKCGKCKQPISFQYPIVELLTAFTFMLLYIKVLLPHMFSLVGVISFIFLCVISALLIIIFVYDIKHKIIPDAAVYSFILLALLSIVWKELTIPTFIATNAIINGVLLALPFFAFWFLSKGRLMGFGDVKLALGIGWLLGASQGVAALLLSFWIGGIFGLGLLALSHTHTMRSQVPFAPFLILGMAIAGLWGISIQTLFPLWG